MDLLPGVRSRDLLADARRRRRSRRVRTSIFAGSGHGPLLDARERRLAELTESVATIG